MNIERIKQDTELTLALEGCLDTSTAPELEKVFNEELKGITKLVLDFAKLEYISSAGLRVLLLGQNIMNEQGSLTVTNVCEDVMEIFGITGFSEVLDIQ